MVRRGQRLIRMVGELHRRGFQQLRIMPYEHPLAWRLAIGPATSFTHGNGAYIGVGDFQIDHLAVYSSASEADYFQWGDCQSNNAHQLADKFLERFPVLCEQGKGRDWAYAGWLSELIGVLEKNNALPVVMEEMGPEPGTLRALPLRKYGVNEADRLFDLPPPGHRRGPPRQTFDPRRPYLPRPAVGEPVKDLTQFGPIASLIGVAMAVGVMMFEARDEDAGHGLLLPVAKALSGNDSSYWTDKRRRESGALRADVSVQFDLPPNFLPGMSLEEVVLFGLEHITLAVRRILKQTEATHDWDGITGPKLMELHAFSTCVFIGTASRLYENRTLDSFIGPDQAE